MKTLAIVTALFLAQPGTNGPKQSLMPNVHKTSSCSSLPQAPQGCMADSAKCVCSDGSCSWEWTC